MQNGSLTRMPGRAPGSTLARVGSIPAGDDVLDPDEPTYDLPRVAELLGVPVSKVAQQLREGHLVRAARWWRGDPSGLLHQLRSGGQEPAGAVDHPARRGYRDTEIMRWLFTPDPSLTITRDGSRDAVSNARPVDALHAHQAREVVRRAQAMAY